MLRLIISRLGLSLATLLGVSLLIFVTTEILPGDVATSLLGQNKTPEAVKALRETLGLDRPAPYRYLEWLGNFVQGDVGKSLASRRDVAPELRERLWNTLELAGLSAVISVPLAIMLGLMAAVWNGGILDRLTSMLSLVAVSVPEFFIAYLLIALLSMKMGWLPSLSVVMDDNATVWEHLRAIALPTLTLVLVVVAHMMRLTRAAVIGVLDSSFIEMLVLKGVPNWRIILQHAVPNVLGPIINVVAVNLAYLIVGVVVVETVFVYPGLGQYMVDSVSKRDIPVVQTCGLIFATIYVGLNAVADLLGVLVNPRLRHPR